MFKTASSSHVADDRFSESSLSWIGTMNLGLVQFAESHGVTLGETTLERITSGHPGYTVEKAKRFVLFQERVNRELLRHRILLRNPYFAWFRRGEMTTNQLRGFVSQFSVFSNLFLLALTKRTIEAESLLVMRATKEILMNELGVCYRPKKVEQMAEGSGVIVVSGEGSVEGGRYWHAAAHYEWLVDVGAALGLSFEDLGRPCFGNPATLHFGNELVRLYGSSNEQEAMAANVLEQVDQERALVLMIHEVDGLLDRVGRGGDGRDLHADRLDQGLLGQRLDLGRHGGREQQGLPLARDHGEDAPDRGQEAGVEHAIGLVEHEDLDLRQLDQALGVEVA